MDHLFFGVVVLGGFVIVADISVVLVDVVVVLSSAIFSLH